MSELVKIFDTTLRDGEQSPGATMNVAEKVRIAQQLEKLNVDIIEAGFPISSEGDFEAVKAIAKTVRRSEVAALARTNPGYRPGLGGGQVSQISSNSHLYLHIRHSSQAPVKKTKAEVINAAREAVRSEDLLRQC